MNVQEIQGGAVEGIQLPMLAPLFFCSRIKSLLFSGFQFISWVRFRRGSADIHVLPIEKFMYFVIFWYFADFSFPALRVFSFCRFTMKLKVWIFKNSQFCKISAFGEVRKTRRSKRIEESSKTRKLRSVKIMCLCGGVCLFRIVMQIFFLFFACLLSPLLPSSLSRSPFSPFPLSSSALFLLLSLLGSLWWGAARYCRRESRRPLAPLALNKENFAVVTSRNMTFNT